MRRLTFFALLCLLAGCAATGPDESRASQEAPTVTPDAEDDRIDARGSEAEDITNAAVTDAGLVDLSEDEPSMAVAEDSATAVPADEARPAAGPDASTFESQLVVPRGSMELIDWDAIDISTPEQAVHEFFAAIQVGDYDLAEWLMDPYSIRELTRITRSFEWSERGSIANHPDALAAIESRVTDPAEEASRFEIVLQEGARHGAFPLDISKGVYALDRVESESPEAGYQEFTARLRATDALVHVIATLGDHGSWQFRRVAVPGLEPYIVPFGGPEDGRSTAWDPSLGWSTDDRLAAASPTEALAQLAALAAGEDWHHVYFLLSTEAQAHASRSALENPRRLFAAGDAMYDAFRPERTAAYGRQGFVEMMRYGVEQHRLGVPLSEFEVTGERGSTDDRGNDVAILEATHPAEPGAWQITMVEESHGWRLHQIRRSGAPAERLPFSFESTIHVGDSFTGDGRVAEIRELRPLVRATASFLSDEDFETMWANVEAEAHAPEVVWFANAFVPHGALIWLDWKESDGVEYKANAMAELLGLSPTFTWDYVEAVAAYERDEGEWPPVAGLEAFDEWIAPHGYQLVLWDAGWDAYLAFAVPDEAAFLELAADFGMAWSSIGSD